MSKTPRTDAVLNKTPRTDAVLNLSCYNGMLVENITSLCREMERELQRLKQKNRQLIEATEMLISDQWLESYIHFKKLIQKYEWEMERKK